MTSILCIIRNRRLWEIRKARLGTQPKFTPQDADDAAPESQNGGHEENAHNKSPTLCEVANDIPQKNDANSSQYRAEKSAHPPCNRHDDNLSRIGPMKRV